MEIAYRALTETCTLLLDANGYCRSVLAATSSQNGRPARIPESAERCIGAQYVATLDFRDPGGLRHMPERGAPMLFARIEIDGRITLVRSAPLISFETVTQVESGVREHPEREAYGYDDEESTTPFQLDELTIPRRTSTPPQGSSYPSYPPPRTSMKVPITRGFELPRVTIPPPPPTVRTPPPSFAPEPASLRRPGISRVAGGYLPESPTLPFRRVAR
jgi:hypothetical protein